MNYTEAFELADAGGSRWDEQHHGTLLVAGQIWWKNDGFDLMDWLDCPIGHFDSVENALHFPLQSTRRNSFRREAS
jgi:hypothetical protein